MESTKRELFARQGDVLIFKVSKIERELKSGRELVVAEGEKTGHKHLVVAERDSAIEFAEDGAVKFVRVTNSPAVIQHEEHGTTVLPVGDYEIRPQREYDPVAYQRKVSD